MSQQINLYEARLRPRHELALARNLGVCALVLLVLITALALWVRADAARKTEAAAISQKQLADEQEKLTALAKEVGQRQVSPSLLAEISSAKSMLLVRNEVMTVLDSGQLGNSSGFSAFMSGFARQTQNNLWLTGFSISLGGDAIEINGRLLDSAKLPIYVQALSNEPVFRGRRFAALEMRDVEPEVQKTDLPGSAKVPDTGVPLPAVAKLPRFVEFTLRSENVSAVDVAKQSGAKP